MTLNPSEIQTFTLPMYGGRVAMLQAPTNLSLEDAELLEASFQIIKKTLIARESLNASSVQESAGLLPAIGITVSNIE